MRWSRAIRVVLVLLVAVLFGLVVMYSSSHHLPNLSTSYLSCKYESNQIVCQHSILQYRDTFHQSSPASTEISNNTPGIQLRELNTQSVLTPAQQSDHGYVLTIFYSGQQAAGVNALISQQCWVGSFGLPMYIVEPYIENSILVSSAGPDSVNSSRFSDHFDIGAFNTAAKSMGYAQLATWEEFIQTAKRNAILIDFDVGGGKAAVQRKSQAHVQVMWQQETGCYNRRLGLRLSYLVSNGFCIRKVVFISHLYTTTQVFNDSEMSSFIFGTYHPRDITLIFRTWRSPWYVPNPKLDNPNICKHAFTSGIKENLYQSRWLVELAEYYEKMFLKPRNSLAVMLRTEHVINRLAVKHNQGKMQDTRRMFDECMEKVVTTAHDLQEELATEAVFVTADFGKYGSGSWNMPLFTEILESIGKDHVLHTAKETVSTLYRHKMTFEQWEDTFSQATGGIEDRGNIAALQRTIASRADCLILVGGGNFLKLAREEYIHNHPNQTTQCLHYVCFK